MINLFLAALSNNFTEARHRWRLFGGNATGGIPNEIRQHLSEVISHYHANNAAFIYWLAQYDGQRLYLEDGFTSTYDFLVRCHSFSEGSAWRRIRVARLSLKVPAIHELIAAGYISFTVLSSSTHS